MTDQPLFSALIAFSELALEGVICWQWCYLVRHKVFLRCPRFTSRCCCMQDAKVTSYLATSGEEGETWQGRLGVLADQLSTGIQRLRDPPLTPPSSQPPGEVPLGCCSHLNSVIMHL